LITRRGQRLGIDHHAFAPGFVPRDLFIDGHAEQGVRAGQVHHRVLLALDREPSFCARDSLARPVADVLVQASDGVEGRALPRVRVARLPATAARKCEHG
jgi:hypothetical protein